MSSREGSSGQDFSAPSTSGSRLSVARELPWHKRGVRVRDLQNLVRDASRILELDENHCATSTFTVVSSVEVDDDLFDVQLQTHTDHRLYRLDRVAVHALGEREGVPIPEERTAARSGLLRAAPSHRRFGTLPHSRSHSEQVDVVNVLSPRSVEVRVTGSQLSTLSCQKLSMPLNMHKLTGELLIPLTTIEERVVHIRDSADARLLLNSLNSDKRTVERSLMLPAYGTGGLIQINQGMAVHGSLSTTGTIRRPYWSLDDRTSMWETGVSDSRVWQHGRTQVLPDAVPVGMAEAEQWICPDTILERASKGGFLLVLRRGVSLSEMVHEGETITEFISHNWCGSSVDLIRTLQSASVRSAWICTFALNQHAVPCLSSGVHASPFYLALKGMRSNGRVIMVLDQDATALTRMWCVFEVWVSRSLRLTFQMFLPTGEFNFFGTDEASRKVRRRLVGLQVASAVCSVEGDTEMILRVIDQSDGGRAAVAWQVKRTMSASAVAFLLLLLGDSSSFLFAMPWILGLTETWTMKTVDHLQLNTYPRWLVRLTASIFVFFPGLFHLRHWRWLANPSDVVTTFSALWVLMLPEQRAEGFPGEIPSTLCQRCRHYARRPLLGFDQAFVAGFLAVALLEMICVLALIVAIPWWKRHDTQGVTDALLCSEQTSTPSCVLLTLYLLLKTLPWIVGFLANAVRQVRGTRQDVDVRMKDFLVASPRVGFLLALLSLTVMSLRQQRSFCCHDDGTTCDLTHLSFAQQGDVMLSMFMVGLSAWGISVAWSCGALVQELTCKTLRRALGVVVVLLFLSLPVGIITMHQFDPDDSWLHLELGCAVWVTASVFFHGKDLWAEFVRTLARIAHQFRSGEGAPPRMATHGSAGLAET